MSSVYEHLLLHTLDEMARGLDAAEGTFLDGHRVRRCHLEHSHAQTRLVKQQTDAPILGVRYLRMPSASPESLAAARATMPRRHGSHTPHVGEASADVSAAEPAPDSDDDDVDDRRRSSGLSVTRAEVARGAVGGAPWDGGTGSGRPSSELDLGRMSTLLHRSRTPPRGHA